MGWQLLGDMWLSFWPVRRDLFLPGTHWLPGDLPYSRRCVHLHGPGDETKSTYIISPERSGSDFFGGGGCAQYNLGPWGTMNIPSQVLLDSWLVKRKCAKLPNTMGCIGAFVGGAGRWEKMPHHLVRETGFRRLLTRWSWAGSMLSLGGSKFFPFLLFFLSPPSPWREPPPPGDFQPLTGPIPSSKSVWIGQMSTRRKARVSPAVQCCWA